MRAIQQTRFGGPEVLELVELPDPLAGVGEELVRVTRAGLNFADIHKRENQYVKESALPRIPGVEVAGVRADTGERVVALLDDGGGYAEQVVAPEDRVWPIPDGLADETALALLVQGLTAWHLYRTQGRVAEGETVVVISGAGGVGSLAVQLGHALGAGRVIATASSEEKRALCLELGADAAVDGAAEGLTDRLLEANGGRPVDVVLEMSGGAVFEACRSALAPLGRIVAYGISSRERNELTTGQLLRASHTVVGFWLWHLFARPDELVATPLADLFARAARDELRVVVGGVYPLTEARRAQEELAARRTRGKLLLDVAS